MTHHGEEKINRIRYRFNPSMGINFQGAKKSAQTSASSDWGKLIRRWGKMYLTGPHQPSATVPVSQRARVIFWIMDSATSPFGSAQNDGVESMLVGVKVLGL